MDLTIWSNIKITNFGWLQPRLPPMLVI